MMFYIYITFCEKRNIISVLKITKGHYNGRNCGSCDNLNTARYFLMKFKKWIDGKVEIMHVLSFC